MFKRLIEGKKAALFDLDGTIVDDEAFWQYAMAQTLKSEGINPYNYEALIRTTGMSNVEKWKIIVENNQLKSGRTPEELAHETQEAFLKSFEKSNIQPVKHFWTLAAYLKGQKGFKLGLITNTPKEVAERILKKLGINETFDLRLFGEDVKNKKPDPEIYLKAVRELGVKNTEVLVFEDSPAGAAAASKANLEMVIVWNPDIPKSDYPENVLLFVPTFEGLANNMDHTFEEAYLDYKKRLTEIEEAKNKDSSQQTQ